MAASSLFAPTRTVDRSIVWKASAGPLATALVFVLGALGAMTLLPVWVQGDTVAALEWGRQLSAGELTSFAPGPTPHPLPIAIAALLAPLGTDGAYDAIAVLFGGVAFGALLALVFDIATRLRSPLAGVMAVALMLTSAPVLLAAVGAYLDPAFAAFVLAALALEIRRPGRETGPLVALALAGLLRPEAWVLAGAYWLWVCRGATAGRRVQLGLLAASAPLVWMAMDLAVMGDPLYSLHVTDTASGVFYRQFTVADNAEEALRQLVAYVGVLGLAAAALGLRSLLVERPHAARVLVGATVITLGVYGGLVVTGMSSNARYLLVPATVLILLAGVAAGSVSASHARSSARVLALVTVLMLAAQLQQRLDVPAGVHDGAAIQSAIVDDAASLAARPEARALFANCRTLAAPGAGAMRFTSFFSGRSPREWTIDAAGRTAPDLFLAPANRTVRRLFLGRTRVDRATAFSVPAGMRSGPGNASWQLYVRPGAC